MTTVDWSLFCGAMALFFCSAGYHFGYNRGWTIGFDSLKELRERSKS